MRVRDREMSQATVDGFHEKKVEKDESVIFWLYHVFGETYIYIHSHIFLYHLLT